MNTLTEDKEKYLTQLEAELINNKFIEGDKINRNLLDDIDVIGFDIDHTLSIYNTSNMVQLLYESFSKFLILEKGYPKEISYENNKDFVVKTSHNEILIDFINGNALKIDINKEIVKGYHGKKELSKEEINALYPNGKYEPYESGVGFKDNLYYFNKCNFEYHIVPLVLVCVHYFDEGLIKCISCYKDIKDHLFESLFFNFKLKDEFADFHTSGYYFPEIAKHPELYFYKYSARELLKQLRKKGKKLFFATNSYKTYAEFVLKHTVGEDYKEYFDLGVWFSKKPMFFEAKPSNPELRCYFEDKTKIPIEEMNDEIYNKIKGGDYLIFEGSYKVVENYFKKALNKKDIKCVYVGDDLFNDCCAPSKLNEWKGIFISDCIKTGFIGSNPENFTSNWKEADEDKSHIDVKAGILSKNTLIALSNIEGLKYFI